MLHPNDPLWLDIKALEAAVADTWSTTLGLRAVDTRKSFTSLGGNSLQAASLVTALSARFDLGDKSSRLLTLPTVADQAAYIFSLRN